MALMKLKRMRKNINNKKYFESFLNCICEVCWLDASGSQKEKLSKINHIEPSALLIPTLTYGVIYKVDSLAMIILQEKSEDECDYTCIPLSWIVDIKELQSNGQTKSIGVI